MCQYVLSLIVALRLPTFAYSRFGKVQIVSRYRFTKNIV